MIGESKAREAFMTLITRRQENIFNLKMIWLNQKVKNQVIQLNASSSSFK